MIRERWPQNARNYAEPEAKVLRRATEDLARKQPATTHSRQ
jgi:hypothetical protein